MISAATVSSLRVFLIRLANRSLGLAPAAATSGIMLTPVSKPDNPNTNSGKAIKAGPTMSTNPVPFAVNACVHVSNTSGLATTSLRPTTTMTALSKRNTPTRGMATTTASLNPRRKTTPRINNSTTVTGTAWPSKNPGRYGFSSIWTVASADDKVMVIIHDVATNPSSIKTNVLPRQNGSNRSSIATEPWPWGLSAAIRRYMGSIPSRVRATINNVASGDTAPATNAAIAGR